MSHLYVTALDTRYTAGNHPKSDMTRRREYDGALSACAEGRQRKCSQETKFTVLKGKPALHVRKPVQVQFKYGT